MSSTIFVNNVTLTDDDWFNDVNRLHYTIFSDPANAATALANLLGAARTASSGVYTAWDPSDVAGTATAYSGSTFTSTSTATDYITAALSSGTTTYTCVKAGVFRFTVLMQCEILVNTTYLNLFATIGGTATRLLGVTTALGLLASATLTPASGSPTGGCGVFYAVMTAGQTVTILPKIAVVSGGGATTDYTTQCTVSAEFTGT